ncbi:MAG: Nucleotidyltransferase domain protein [Methanocella sp. PtaU1.Bin125]|nr:MAG: Nucleotidyltransferase domain protein [Methanocella sp. PtaU1.Bin125]
MLTESNDVKILKLFFDGPGVRLHIREVARRAGLSPPGAMKILRNLKDRGLVVEEPGDVVVNYKGNYENQRFVALKRSVNLYSLYASGLVDALAEFYFTPECIVLFGSYAKGEDTGKSDIDIAIVTDTEDLPDLHDYEKKLNRIISIHTIGSLKNAEAGFVNSLANGIVLYGYLEVT